MVLAKVEEAHDRSRQTVDLGGTRYYRDAQGVFRDRQVLDLAH